MTGVGHISLLIGFRLIRRQTGTISRINKDFKVEITLESLKDSGDDEEIEQQISKE